MGASNGRTPAVGCGTAPVDRGDGFLYVLQTAGGAVDACLSNTPCYRPAVGFLTNTSTGAGMLRLHTLTNKGNCSSPALPHMPVDGLLEHFNWILPVGWPENGNKTSGTNVSAADLSGVFVNNDNPAGTAGGIFLRRANESDCMHMHSLPDCTAVPNKEEALVPSTCAAMMQADCGAEQGGGKECMACLEIPAHHSDIRQAGCTPLDVHAFCENPKSTCNATMQADCGAEQGGGKECMACLEVPAHHNDIRQAGCTPLDVHAFCGIPSPSPSPGPGPRPVRPTSHNATGCYVFGGSAGRAPLPGCGMAPPKTNGNAYVLHRADGSVSVCLHQFCSRRLSGNFSTSSNGVGFMIMQTDFGVGNCTASVSRHFPKDGLFAHIDFVLPANWPESGIKTRGARTDGAHTIAGMFINNGHALAGILKMNPDTDPAACSHLGEIPFCADFVPRSSLVDIKTLRAARNFSLG